MKRLVLACATVSMLTGCVAQGYVPLTETQINEVGEIVEMPIGATRDASIAKEGFVHRSLQRRDIEYGKAYKESGFKMEFASVEIAKGIVAYLPKSISFKEVPRFEQPLPLAPSEHPVWKTVNNVVDKGLWAWLGSEFFSFGKSAIDAAGDKFAGDYIPQYSNNPMSLTGNTNGNITQAPYTVEPVIVEPFIVPGAE